ncbi:MAG: TAXI family TRAP transporter solute-binding subunit [Deltaproteobacteria bacterium]|nr:TAXI family TRAP transporter solute-binding subunit [Deltaproteobacteria bacterium]
MGRSKSFLFVAVILFAALFLLPGIFSGPASAQTVEMSMGCGPSVAAGYPAGVALSNFLNKKIEGLNLIPIELGTAAAIRRMAAGEMDLTYSNAFDLIGTYTNKGAFEKNPLAPGTQPYQGIWFWPISQFMVTRVDTDIYTLDDLKGKNISLGSPKEGLYAFAKEAFNALGLTEQWTERVITASDRPQTLKSKSVDALLAVVASLNTLAGHTMEVELYNKLRAVKMSKAQEDIINNTPGITIIYIPTNLFKEDIGIPEVPAISNMYGWSFAPSADAEMVYRFVKACFENAQQLAEMARVFEMFSKDPKGTAIKGLTSASTTPVHPGAARYYKEIGIWDNSWIEGKGK